MKKNHKYWQRYRKQVSSGHYWGSAATSEGDLATSVIVKAENVNSYDPVNPF